MLGKWEMQIIFDQLSFQPEHSLPSLLLDNPAKSMLLTVDLLAYIKSILWTGSLPPAKPWEFRQVRPPNETCYPLTGSHTAKQQGISLQNNNR